MLSSLIGDRHLKARGIFERFHARHFTADLCEHGNALRAAGLEQLLDTRQTLSDVAAVGACHTAGMERTHGQLRTRLTDGLCRHDADSLADLDILAGRHIAAIALLADAMHGFAGKGRTDIEAFDAAVDDLLRDVFCDEFIRSDDQFAALRIDDILLRITADQAVIQGFDL